MPRPAVILCDGKNCDLKIAGLTVLDRLIVTLHRAGCSPLRVQSSNALPELKRTRALGIAFTQIREVESWNEPTLIADGNLVVQVKDVQRVLEHGGVLMAEEGSRLPIGVVSAFEAVGANWVEKLTPVKPSGVARIVRNESDAKDAERALWSVLTSASDGWVDVHFNRPCGRHLSRLLVRTPVTPNQVSMASILLGVLAGWFFARGEYHAAVLGAVLFQISAIVDCIDGDIARMVFKESPLGKWLDIVGDQVVHAAVFIGIGMGVWRMEGKGTAGWLAGSAVIGALIAFVVIVRGMRGAKSKTNVRLQNLIDRATNRDFSVLVLLLAVFEGLEWFLWMAAIGSHLFWVTALALQWSASLTAKEPSVSPPE